MGAFDNFIRDLDQMGVTEVVLPFLLFFVIIYVATKLSGVLGGQQKPQVVVSLVLSLLVVIPHVLNKYPSGSDPVDIVNGLLPTFVLILAAVVFLAILLGVFGMQIPWNANKGWIIFGGLVVILWLFGESAGWFSTNLSFGISNIIGDDALTVLVMLAVFALIIWFIVSDGGDANDNKPSLLERLGPFGRGGPGGGS